MPSFDIVSKTDIAEVDNAINGAMREISSRYDFKNSQSSIKRETDEIHLIAEDNYKIDQLQQIFRTHCVKRKLSTGAFEFSKIESGNTVTKVFISFTTINSALIIILHLIKPNNAPKILFNQPNAINFKVLVTIFAIKDIKYIMIKKRAIKHTN